MCRISQASRPSVPSRALVFVLVLGVGSCDSDGGLDPSSPVRFPLDSWSMSQDFGVWNDYFEGYHLAEDARASGGTRVYALADGVVGGIFAAPEVQGYGAVMMIEHEIGGEFVTSLYGHVSARRGFQVSVGEAVSKGQLVAYIADDDEDGGPWPPHLHFGIRRGGYDIDAQICGLWLYVGYTQTCGGVTHEQYRSFWYDPSDFIRSHGG